MSSIFYQYNYRDNTNTSIAHGVIGLLSKSYLTKYTNPSQNIQPQPFVAILYWDNPKNLSLQVYNQSVSTQKELGLYSSNTQVVTISGKTAYHDTKANCDSVHCDRYLIPYNNKFIAIQRFYQNTADPTPDEVESAVFTKIIASIKIE